METEPIFDKNALVGKIEKNGASQNSGKGEGLK